MDKGPSSSTAAAAAAAAAAALGEPAGVSGLLWVHLLAGRGLRPSGGSSAATTPSTPSGPSAIGERSLFATPPSRREGYNLHFHSWIWGDLRPLVSKAVAGLTLSLCREFASTRSVLRPGVRQSPQGPDGGSDGRPGVRLGRDLRARLGCQSRTRFPYILVGPTISAQTLL